MLAFASLTTTPTYANEIQIKNNDDVSKKGDQQTEEIILDSDETFTAPEGATVEVSYIEPMEDDSFQPEHAPHCLYAYKSWGAVQVQNSCPDGWRVKVILRYAGDTGCKWVAPGTRTNIGWAGPSKIDGLVLC